MNAKFVALFLFLCASQLASADPPAISHIPRRAVVSVGIRSIGYSKRLHILEIEFVNGAVYRYRQVARSVYQELLTADSKARYYDKNVKGRYRSVRMRSRTKR
jgi:KTSC domain